ncbi:hypothetical protein DFH09DRAFT_480543 [Mycena vulgaris]|nr:hypothetical protein DFH09DRAFT_480543 [Mycena vulgaris]
MQSPAGAAASDASAPLAPPAPRCARGTEWEERARRIAAAHLVSRTPTRLAPSAAHRICEPHRPHWSRMRRMNAECACETRRERTPTPHHVCAPHPPARSDKRGRWDGAVAPSTRRLAREPPTKVVRRRFQLVHADSPPLVQRLQSAGRRSPRERASGPVCAGGGPPPFNIHTLPRAYGLRPPSSSSTFSTPSRCARHSSLTHSRDSPAFSSSTSAFSSAALLRSVTPSVSGESGCGRSSCRLLPSHPSALHDVHALPHRTSLPRPIIATYPHTVSD